MGRKVRRYELSKTLHQEYQGVIFMLSLIFKYYTHRRAAGIGITLRAMTSTIKLDYTGLSVDLPLEHSKISIGYRYSPVWYDILPKPQCYLMIHISY